MSAGTPGANAPARPAGPPGARQPVERCPLCGARDRCAIDREEGIDLLACSGCGHWYAASLPRGDLLDYYRQTGGYDDARRYMRGLKVDQPDAPDAGSPQLARLARIIALRRMQAVLRHAPPGPVLEVGCGEGALLRQLAERGREVFACELHEGNVATLRAWLGSDRVWSCAIGQIPAGRLFAAVAMFHVLEHLEDAPSDLRHVRRLLAPGGVLVLAVPNGGFERLWRSLGRRQGYALSQHLHVFTQRRLLALVQCCGFEVVETPFWFRIEMPWDRTSPAGRCVEWVRYVVSRLRPRVLYLPNELVVCARAVP